MSFKGIVENCWAATLWEYNKIYTPYLLYSELLRYSIRNGNKIFSFGRSSFDSGTLSFKKHWKPEIIPLIFNFSETHKKGLKGNKSLTNLYGKYVPEVLNNLVGKVVTKYIY